MGYTLDSADVVRILALLERLCDSLENIEESIKNIEDNHGKWERRR